MVGEWINKVDNPQPPTMTENEIVFLFKEALSPAWAASMKMAKSISHLFYLSTKMVKSSWQHRLPVEKSGTSSAITMSLSLSFSQISHLGGFILQYAGMDYEDIIPKRIAIFERTRSHA